MSYERKTVERRYQTQIDVLKLDKQLITKLSKALIEACGRDGTMVPKSLRINRIELAIVDTGSILPHHEFVVEED